MDKGSITTQESDYALELFEVTAGYGKKQILSDLMLQVAAGKIMVVVGANGAGKSTLLKAAMGLLTPAKGKISLWGHDITRCSVKNRVSKGLGYLLQGGEVFASMSVRENLSVAVSNANVSCSGDAVDASVSMFPFLADCLDRRAGLLSGGQRQALALCMVMAQRPRVLLLDEPSAGLAPNVAQAMLTVIRKASTEQSLTVVMVEQRIRKALLVADRAVVLSNGRVVDETSSPRAWLEPGVLDRHFFGKNEMQAQ